MDKIKNKKKYIIFLFATCLLLMAAGCASMMENLTETPSEGIVQTAAEPEQDPATPLSLDPTPDLAPALSSDLAFDNSLKWKEAVFERTRDFHAEMLELLPGKREYFGDIWEYADYDYELSLYDMGFEAPYVSITDMSHDFVLTQETLYSIEDGGLKEIITSQWFEIYRHLDSGVRDKLSATWASGFTWSETQFFQYVDGEWEKLSYIFTTGSSYRFYDEATGEEEEWEEAERLLDERLDGYQYIPLEDWFRHTFTYVRDNGEIVPWDELAPAVSAYLDAYDGIEVGIAARRPQ
ncbi:MAG: hypothetical protein FWG91_05110 [Lachnospiraceae bacterium]|nr:hypothetical protein [Lachnospiraceae bacterium]